MRQARRRPVRPLLVSRLMSLSVRRTWAVAMAAASFAVLAACASASTPEDRSAAGPAATESGGQAATASAVPDQGLFNKGISFCIVNKTDTNAVWSDTARGGWRGQVVSAGTTTCYPPNGGYKEPESEVNLSIQMFDGGPSPILVDAVNPAIGWPSMSITYNGETKEETGMRADARRKPTVGGRAFEANRFVDDPLTWYSVCGNHCSERHDDTVKHMEVVLLPR